MGGDGLSVRFSSLKIQQAAFRHQEECRPFMFYIDEFQNFKTSAFEKILSMAGGFNLCLTLANQYFDQLDPETRGAIINNVSTFFLFRMGTENARHLAGELKEPALPPDPPKPDINALKKKITFVKAQIEHHPTNRVAMCAEKRIRMAHRRSNQA